MAYKGTNHISARVQHSLQVIWCALCPSSLEYTLLLTPQGSLAVDFRSLASGRMHYCLPNIATALCKAKLKKTAALGPYGTSKAFA